MTGQLCRRLGDYDRSREVLRQAVRLFRDSGYPESAAFCLHSLAETERDLGHITLARRFFTIALREHDKLGSERGIAYDLEGLASTAVLSGQTDQALRYLGAATQFRDAAGAHLSPAGQAELDRIFSAALAGVSRLQQHPAFQRGRTQPAAATVATALGTAETATGRPVAGLPSRQESVACASCWLRACTFRGGAHPVQDGRPGHDTDDDQHAIERDGKHSVPLPLGARRDQRGHCFRDQSHPPPFRMIKIKIHPERTRDGSARSVSGSSVGGARRIRLADLWLRRARLLLPALFVMLAVVTVWVTTAARSFVPVSVGTLSRRCST